MLLEESLHDDSLPVALVHGQLKLQQGWEVHQSTRLRILLCQHVEPSNDVLVEHDGVFERESLIRIENLVNLPGLQAVHRAHHSIKCIQLHKHTRAYVKFGMLTCSFSSVHL